MFLFKRMAVVLSWGFSGFAMGPAEVKKEREGLNCSEILQEETR